MRYFITIILVICAGLSFGAQTQPSSHARLDVYSFETGNLLQNWSFENASEGWSVGYEDPSNSVFLHQRELSSLWNVKAVSGTHVARVQYISNIPIQGVFTDTLPIKPGTTYSLSFYSALFQASQGVPVEFMWISLMDTVSNICWGGQYGGGCNLVLLSSTDKIEGAIPPGNGWMLNSQTVTAPQWATHVKIFIGRQEVSPLGGMLLLDDVLFEPGSKPLPRSKIGEHVSLIDNLGKTVQSFTRLSESGVASIQPPASCLDGIEYYGLDRIDIRNQASVPGNVMAGGFVTVESGSRVEGSITSGNSVFLGDRASVTDDVRYAGSLTQQNQVEIGGRSIKGSFKPCDLPAVQVNPGVLGATDLYTTPDQKVTLSPGVYRNIDIRDRGEITLSSGEYDFNSFSTGTDVKIRILAENGPITVRIATNLGFADRTVMLLSDNSTTNLVRFHFQGTSQVRFGCNSQFFGQVYAPNAAVQISNQSRMQVQVWAKSVSIEAQNILVHAEYFGVIGDSKWKVSHAEWDDYGRPSKSYLPFVEKLDQPGLLAEAGQLANQYYDGNSAPNAGGLAYVEKEYLLDGSTKYFSAGVAGHDAPTQQGTLFVGDLAVPSRFEGLGAIPRTTVKYVLDWSVGSDHNYSLVWRDLEGKTVKVSSNQTWDASKQPSEWVWTTSSYDYYPNGSVREGLSPNGIPSRDHRDSRGLVYASYDPDRGIAQSWRDAKGRTRLIRNEEHKLDGKAVSTDFDSYGRFVKECLVSTGSKTDVEINQLVLGLEHQALCEVLNGVELRGVVYDSQSDLPAIFSLPAQVTLMNTNHRVVAKWRTNADASVTSLGANSLVADLYSYDGEGRISRIYRYQPGMPGDLKLTYVAYGYDKKTKRVSSEFFGQLANGAFSILESRYFDLDNLGRLERISDGHGNELASYRYNELGDLEHTLLGNQISISSQWGLYGLDKRAALLPMEDPLQTKTLYSEELVRGIPESGEDGIGVSAGGRSDGRITREIHRRESGQVLFDYGWSVQGQMSVMEKFERPGDAGAWSHTESSNWNYNADGGVKSLATRGTDGVVKSKEYMYLPGTHQLNYVDGSAGTLSSGGSRNWNLPGTFMFDLAGRMVSDNSQGTLLEYGADGRMIGYTKECSTTGGHCIHSHRLHDFNGWLVGEFVTDAGVDIESRWSVEIGGGLRAEVHQRSSTEAPQVMTVLHGASGTIGRRNVVTNMREWYVKDRKGSVVRVIPENGSGGNEYAYSPYGQKTEMQLSTTSPEPTQTWTGKPYDKRTGWTTVGVRVWDSELGIWLSGDPAGQFADPYTYGGDPVNGVDYDGRKWYHSLAMVAGYPLMGGFPTYLGYQGGSAMNDGESNPNQWSGGSNTWEGMGVGYATGLAICGAAGAGAWAGAAAGTSATGYFGLAYGGFAGAVAGGVVGGAVGGGVGAFSGDVMIQAIARRGNWWRLNRNNWRGTMRKTGKGALIGGLTGGAMSAIAYGVSPAYRQGVHQTVENYGFSRGRHADVMSYDYNVGEGQRATNYYANRVRGYDTHVEFSGESGNGARGAFDLNGDGKTRVFDEAFYDPQSGDFDATGAMQSIDHEVRHTMYNSEYMQNAVANGQLSQEAQRSFVEGNVYLWQQSVMQDYGYSQGTQVYIDSQVAKLPWWMVIGL